MSGSQKLKYLKWKLKPSTNDGAEFRARRFALFRCMVADVLAKSSMCRIIDIGGTPEYWRLFGSDLVADPRIKISILNLSYNDESVSKADRELFSILVGNACNMPEFEADTFDIAHSNSVIEHVGRWCEMESMAKEVQRVAKCHFIQTPYWGFPVEPHNRGTFFHWLPEQIRYRILLKRGLGFWSRAVDIHEAMIKVQSAYLLDRLQFAFLFPKSSIYSEIVWGLTKSLIAVGGANRIVDPNTNKRKLRV